MTSSTMPSAPVENWEQIRDTWVADVESLAHDIEQWAAENDWDSKRESKEITEDEIGSYQIPVVRVHTLQGRVYFEPCARFVLGASGRIELSATPSFAQVVMLRTNGSWRFLTEDLQDLNKFWSRDGFKDIVSLLLRQA